MKKLKALAALVSLLFANVALAGPVHVDITNNSATDPLYLHEKGLVYMTYYPDPSTTLPAATTENVDAQSSIPTVDSIKLVYAAQNTAYPTATCTFEYAATQNYSTKLWTISWLKASAEYSVIRERMYCDSTLSSFDPTTGEATVGFAARYYEL